MRTPALSIWRGRRVQIWLLVVGCVVLLAGIGLVSLLIGTPRLAPPDLWIIVHGGGTALARLVVLQLRLPRLALALLAGAMLALSGAMLQDALRNVLAGPELLGVSAGATVVVAAITILHIAVIFSAVPWLSLAGGLVGGSVVLLAARRMQDPVRLVLTGAALSALLNASVIVLMSLGSQNDISILFLFLVGSLANRTWQHVSLVLPWAVVGIPLALFCARPLNVLQLGDTSATGLGLPVAWTRLSLFFIAVLLTAGAVAVVGGITFLGLIAPHIARRIVGADARRLFPFSMLMGAGILLAADTVTQSIAQPLTIPVGAALALLGAPYFLYLTWRRTA